MNYYIDEAIWQWIYGLLVLTKDIHSKNESQLRLFFEAVWYVLKTGCQWRMLPAYYGHWRAVHRRFFRWCKKGIWDMLFENAKQHPDLECVMIDSTVVRAHCCASGYSGSNQEQEALGRSAGGYSTKVHALVDALGNPLKILVTPGQSSDIKQASQLLNDIGKSSVLADKGYDCDKLIDELKEKDCEAVIPPKKNRKKQRSYDKHLYKERHLIECFFNKIKQFRRVFSRFDKNKMSYLSFINFASILIWLR